LITSWENIIAGDKDEYEKVYLHLYERFYNYGFKFTQDSGLIEDTIQEVLLKLWIDRSKLALINNPAAYLFSSFRNELVRKIKNTILSSPKDLDLSPPEFGPDTIIITRQSDEQLERKLKEAIDRLSPRQREAIFLRFYEGLSYEEVSVVLGITHKATYKLMARALAELKDQMGISTLLILALLRNIYSAAVHF
jgi:RNA polymerase sigma factor (sigma-70 family)